MPRRHREPSFEEMGELERAAKTPDFNLRHPEMNQETEVFVGNFSQDGFDTLGFQKKRLGQQAFDHFGRGLPDLHPVFVDKQEYAPTAQLLAANKRILDRDEDYQRTQREVYKEDRKAGKKKE